MILSNCSFVHLFARFLKGRSVNIFSLNVKLCGEWNWASWNFRFLVFICGNPKEPTVIIKHYLTSFCSKETAYTARNSVNYVFFFLPRYILTTNFMLFSYWGGLKWTVIFLYYFCTSVFSNTHDYIVVLDASIKFNAQPFSQTAPWKINPADLAPNSP